MMFNKNRQKYKMLFSDFISETNQWVGLKNFVKSACKMNLL